MLKIVIIQEYYTSLLEDEIREWQGLQLVPARFQSISKASWTRFNPQRLLRTSVSQRVKNRRGPYFGLLISTELYFRSGIFGLFEPFSSDYFYRESYIPGLKEFGFTGIFLFLLVFLTIY